MTSTQDPDRTPAPRDLRHQLASRRERHTTRQDAVHALVQGAALEIIPLKSATEKLAAVPFGTTITVTCSSKLGLERTLEYTEAAAHAGYRVVPHLAARQIPDEAYLRAFVGRLDAVGVHDLFVIGGDAADSGGPYGSALQVLQALETFSHAITGKGVACYPEGRPGISGDDALASLRRQQPYADHMVSQLCFDATAITYWLEGAREQGVTLPLHLGLAAPMQVRKLAEVSLRIGVGSSVRFLTKQHGFLGNVLRGRSYRPEQLLEQLGDVLTRPDLGVEGLHLFTFNQVDATVAWQADAAA